MMNLNQYVTENPTATLTEAQSYEELSTRMVEGGQMRIFLLETGLYLYFKNHSEEMQVATFDNLISGEPFNFITGHSSNVEGLLDVMAATEPEEEIKGKLDLLKQKCIFWCNPIKNPFAEITQAQLDIAKLSINPKVNVECTYPENDFIENNSQITTSVEISIVEPIPVDDVITFICHSSNEDLEHQTQETLYSLNPVTRCSIRVPANYTGAIDSPIGLTGLKTKVKAFGSSKYNREFTVSIYNTSA